MPNLDDLTRQLDELIDLFLSGQATYEQVLAHTVQLNTMAGAGAQAEANARAFLTNRGVMPMQQGGGQGQWREPEPDVPQRPLPGGYGQPSGGGMPTPGGPTPAPIRTDPNSPALTFDPRGEQQPGQAFTRYLAGLGQMTEPIRGMLEERGKYLQELAPLFGYGVSQEAGGRGMDFLDFYKSGGGAVPSFQDSMGALRGVHSALGGANTPYQQGLAARYDKPVEQLAALQGVYGPQFNPYFRGPLMGRFRQEFEEQQAQTPERSFLDYARSRGYL